MLCWNLSQITQRKDVPTIYFTYSRSEAEARGNMKKDFDLKSFSDERELLVQLVQTAPRRRADNIVNYLQEQTDRLQLYLKALYTARSAYQKRRQGLRIAIVGMLVFLLTLAGLVLETQYPGFFQGVLATDFSRIRPAPLALIGIGTIVGLLLFWKLVSTIYRAKLRTTAEEILESPDKLVTLASDADRQRWEFIRPKAVDALQRDGLDASLRGVWRDLRSLDKARARYTDLRQVQK